MKPLHAVAMGLVIVGLRAGNWDLLPDPLGWLLVLYGVRRLPRTAPYRGSLLALGALALVASGFLWVPDVASRLQEADPSLAWAVNLPQLGFAAVLGWSLATLAQRAGDNRAFRTWRTIATFVLVCILLPVLVWGGGLTALEQPTYVLGSLTLLATIVVGFAHGGRAWADATPAPPEGPLDEDTDRENGPDPRRDRGRSET